MNNQENSIREIISKACKVFNKISERINALVDSSGKDFITLNKNFRVYHQQTNISTKKTQEYLKYIIKIHDKTSNSKLLETALTETDDFQQKLSETITILKSSDKNMNHCLLHINNAKQDIGTLRLLSTNLRFEPGSEATYNLIIEYLNSLQLCYEELEKNTKDCLQITHSIFNTSEDKNRTGTNLLISFLKKNAKAFSTNNQKHKEALAYQKLLDEINNQVSTSTSEIITNLQYQDIIRQKIEHVQAAHEQLLSQLTETSKKKEQSTKKLIKIELLIQIRDIGSLQAAQLIHANEEYQRAVSTILNKFDHLYSILNKTNSIWEGYITPESQFQHKNVSEILDQMPAIINEIEKVGRIVQNFDNQLIAIQNIGRVFNDNLKKLKLLIPDHQSISTHLKTLNINHKNQKDRVNLLEQLSYELTQLSSDYQAIENTYKDNIGLIEKGVKHQKQAIKHLEKIKNIISEANQEVSQLAQADDNDSSFKDLSLINQEEITKVDFSIEQVEYYKQFETEVELIIGWLNDLISELDIENESLDTINLEHIQQLYTMNSERRVHQKLLNKKETESEVEDEDGNIEFF